MHALLEVTDVYSHFHSQFQLGATLDPKKIDEAIQQLDQAMKMLSGHRESLKKKAQQEVVLARKHSRDNKRGNIGNLIVQVQILAEAN